MESKGVWKQLGVNATWFKVKSVIEMSIVLHLCSPVAHTKRKGTQIASLATT